MPDSQPSGLPRKAREEEIPRARFLFASAPKVPPAQAEFLVVTKLRPIERIVASLAWWNEGEVVKFLLAGPPGTDGSASWNALLAEFEADGRVAGRRMEFARLLAEDEPAAILLAECGYEGRHTERVFEAPADAVRERVDAMLERYRPEIPAGWRTEAIRHHPPETVWPLLAPYQLIDLDSLRDSWSSPGGDGYDLAFSSVLLDGSDVLGVLLVRTNAVCLAVDVRVVSPMPPRLRALANLALFDHIARLATPERSSLRVLAFRARQQDHLETANLAKRMGGREVAVRHIYTRPGQAG
ncbi:hypothetical protein [Luteolibacter marinus]|uniref:hypothetical protein n=1 Tax=Luteolibacter marinus TaxID=2776705 RepID=UPI001865CBBF|nr:hypothetical protein [Luteolibacter marinus]